MAVLCWLVVWVVPGLAVKEAWLPRVAGEERVLNTGLAKATGGCARRGDGREPEGPGPGVSCCAWCWGWFARLGAVAASRSAACSLVWFVPLRSRCAGWPVLVLLMLILPSALDSGRGGSRLGWW